MASNAYHLLLPIMKSREVHSQTKIKVYKTLIRSRSEVWTLSQTVEKMLNVLEREVLKKICGPMFFMDSGKTNIIMKSINYTSKWS